MSVTPEQHLAGPDLTRCVHSKGKHDDVMIWNPLLALCEGNPPVPGGFPSQRVSDVEFLCSFILLLIDLKRHAYVTSLYWIDINLIIERELSCPICRHRRHRRFLLNDIPCNKWRTLVISKQEVSAPISCWVTFDPAESPILPRQNMLCTYDIEYNPQVSNEKSQVSLRFIIKIQQILCVYMYGYKKIQGFLWKLC